MKKKGHAPHLTHTRGGSGAVGPFKCIFEQERGRHIVSARRFETSKKAKAKKEGGAAIADRKSVV